MKNTLKALLLGIALVAMSYQVKAQLCADYVVLFENDSIGDCIRPDVCPQGYSLTDISYFLGGYYYGDNLHEARSKGVSGVVLYTFKVNKEGVKSDWKLYKGIGYGCDEDARCLLMMMPDTVSPAIYQGQPVDVLGMFSVRYFREGCFNEIIAKDFDMMKWIEQEAIRIGKSDDDNCKSVESVEELNFESMVPYVSFTVKKKSGKIKNVDVAKSSGFANLDSEALRAMEHISKWPERAEDQDVQYVLPVKFEPNK